MEGPEGHRLEHFLALILEVEGPEGLQRASEGPVEGPILEPEALLALLEGVLCLHRVQVVQVVLLKESASEGTLVLEVLEALEAQMVQMVGH